jgi:di/tricarboxylate transporter
MDFAWIDAVLIVGLFAAIGSGRVAIAPAFLVFIIAVVLLDRLSFSKVLPLLADPGTAGVLSLVIFSSVIGRLLWLRRMMFGGRARGKTLTLMRFLGVAGIVSSVTPNTAVVGTFIGPATRQSRTSPHLLLLPLSYVALAGGMVTQFGTSASVMTVSEASKAGVQVGVMEFAPVGFAALLAVFIVLVIAAPLMLRSSAGETSEETERFHVQAEVAGDGPLVGKSVAEGGLRSLDGFYLAEIVRSGRLIAPVSPTDIIEAGDTLIFVGDIRRIEALSAIRGLKIAEKSGDLQHGRLYQAVISAESVLNGRSLKDIGFRARFDASVLAVRRGDERLSGQLGDMRLRSGDLLLLAAGPDFASRDNIRPNFHLVEADDLGGWRLSARDATLVTLAFLTFVGAVLFDLVSFGLAAFLLVVVAVSAKWISARDIRRSFPFDLTIALWGSLVLAALIQKSGMDALVANWLVSLVGHTSPFVILCLVFFATWVLTELLSNVSAALTALPVALELSQALGMPPEPWVLVCAFGASASFLIPFGYQTHLMVMSPGRYSLGDFLRLGPIVLVAYTAASLGMIWYLWFQGA